GLCRTEHMFFAEERLPHVVRMIMAAPRVKALAERLEARQRALAAQPSAAEAKALKAEIAAPERQRKEPLREDTGALAELLPFQRADFRGLFQAMDGLPVTIRTLDPPLHEFLPKREELMVDIARLPRATAAEKRDMAKRYRLTVARLRQGMPELLRRAGEVHAFHPHLGARGRRPPATSPRA